MSISLKNLSKRYGTTHAVEDVTTEITHGSLTAILGPSGSGKSTLLKLIAGLERPDEGTVVIDGADMTNVDPRHRDIGFCFQNYAPFRHMNVAKNVAFGLKVRKRPKKEIDERVEELLVLVKLQNKAKSSPLNSPAESVNEWPWQERWPLSRACCYSTSPSGHWTP